jgi:hypothetical protein
VVTVVNYEAGVGGFGNGDRFVVELFGASSPIDRFDPTVFQYFLGPGNPQVKAKSGLFLVLEFRLPFSTSTFS